MLALVSKNAGCSWAWPVTFAPASSRAVVMPLIVGPSAPGAVTSTTFCAGQQVGQHQRRGGLGELLVAVDLVLLAA